MSKQLSPQFLLSLHQRLLNADPVAGVELAEAAIEPLAQALLVGNRRLRDESMADEAAIEAVLDLIRAPQKYDPERSNVWTFLKLAARRNLGNLLLKERRQKGRTLRFAAVALHDPARKRFQDEIVSKMIETESQATWRQRLDAETAFLSETELAVLRLMTDGVRATAAYAQVMGIQGKPPGEQKSAVKQVKDRLLKRLKRSLQEREDV